MSFIKENFKKGLATLVIVGISTLWAGYFLLTFAYNLPNNPVKIQMIDAMDLWDDLFFQRWNYFSPPPNYNDRLYYNFTKSDDPSTCATFECFESLFEKKRINHPFNGQDEIFDYVLSGSVTGVTDEIREELEFTKALGKVLIKSSADQKKDELSIISDIIDPNKTTSPSVKTLARYGALLAKAQGLAKGSYQVSIICTKKIIPKFIDRDKNEKNIEELVFSLTPFELKIN